MREIAILFSTPMVQAIQELRKNMTRRVIKPQPDHRHRDIVFEYGKLNEYSQIAGVWNVVKQHKPPYQPGDLLYVQETWKISSFSDKTHALAIRFKAGGAKEAWFDSAERYEKFKKFYFKKGWQSPYFMPKEAARIWLEVTNVRVERLQEITEDDARAEGVRDPYDYQAPEYYEQHHMKGLEINTAAFAGLWDSLNAKRGYGWETNPCVFVNEFRRL